MKGMSVAFYSRPQIFLENFSPLRLDGTRKLWVMKEGRGFGFMVCHYMPRI